MKSILFSIALGFMGVGCAPSNAQDAVPSVYDKADVYSSIYWSDADSGRLGKLKFRLANVDAPETGSMKQRGGAKCEFERELGYASKAYIVGFTKDKAIRIVRDYGEDRYGRLVVDLEADGADVAKAGVAAGHLRDWLHRVLLGLKTKSINTLGCSSKVQPLSLIHISEPTRPY